MPWKTSYLRTILSISIRRLYLPRLFVAYADESLDLPPRMPMVSSRLMRELMSSRYHERRRSASASKPSTAFVVSSDRFCFCSSTWTSSIATTSLLVGCFRRSLLGFGLCLRLYLCLVLDDFDLRLYRSATLLDVGHNLRDFLGVASALLGSHALHAHA